MATNWYYKLMGVENGPVSSDELLALARAGRILSDTLVRKSGTEQWALAERVKGLFDPATPLQSHEQPQSHDIEPTPNKPAVAPYEPQRELPVEARNATRLQNGSMRYLLIGMVVLSISIIVAAVLFYISKQSEIKAANEAQARSEQANRDAIALAAELDRKAETANLIAEYSEKKDQVGACIKKLEADIAKLDEAITEGEKVIEKIEADPNFIKNVKRDADGNVESMARFMLNQSAFGRVQLEMIQLYDRAKIQVAQAKRKNADNRSLLDKEYGTLREIETALKELIQ